ncbi:MAG: tetratricopeptide repeat protein [Gemmatimonadales bacterium]
MRLTRAMAALAAGLILVVAELPAQLRPNRLPPQRVNTNPRLLVATPHVFATVDSAAAVQVGNGMRNRLSGQAERWYNVITRDQMNEALAQYAYPLDAVLPPLVVRSLGNAMQARTMVSSSMVRGADGRYTIQARLAGINDDAGHMVTLTQAANQSPEAFGVAAANALLPAFRAMPDAKACMDEMAASRDRAAGEARKALSQQPNHGLASYCLGEIAFAQGDTTAAIRNFAAAAEGDPLSLKAWNQLAILYQYTADSANTVTTFQQMLRVAPTNQALREEAFGLFLRYDRPGAARQVAEEGLELDPQNADLWDLKSNACLYAEDYVCAIDALETAYSVDSTKADTTFFQKITYAASRQPDTTRFLRWSQAGVKKYPDNPFMLEQLIQAYGYAGPVDSVVAVTHRLVAMDNSDMTPVIRAIQALGNSGRIREALPLGQYIDQYGNADDKNNFAGLLVNAAQPMLAEPDSAALIVEMTRKAISLTPEGSQTWRAANLFFGGAAWQTFVVLDQGIEASRSCETARQMQALLDEIGPAMTAGRALAEDYAGRILQGVEAYRPRVASLTRAYCR